MQGLPRFLCSIFLVVGDVPFKSLATLVFEQEEKKEITSFQPHQAD